MPLQVFDMAIEAGAEDVQPVEDGEGLPDGYKVRCTPPAPPPPPPLSQNPHQATAQRMSILDRSGGRSTHTDATIQCLQPAAALSSRKCLSQVISSLESFGEVRDLLTEKGLDIDQEESGLIWAPVASVEVRTTVCTPVEPPDPNTAGMHARICSANSDPLPPPPPPLCFSPGALSHIFSNCWTLSAVPPGHTLFTL